MPLSEEEQLLFAAPRSSNVVALPRAAAAQVNPQPDAMGQAVNLAPKVGMPASVIGADLETYQQAERGQNAARAIERNGWISDYIARNPEAADVSSDDYDRLENLSKKVERFSITGRQGGLINSIPEFVFQSIPETWALLSSSEGRARAAKNFPTVVKHLTDPLFVPGDVMTQGFDIHDPVDMDRALNLGFLVGLAKTAPKIGLPVKAKGEIGPATLSSAAEIDRFLMDAFLTKGQNPKVVFQIEHAKADAASFNQAVAAAAESQTKTRAPSLIEDFIEGHGNTPIQLPAQAILDIYRAEGKTPTVGDGLFGFVPGLAKDLPLALETGAEITVPASKYIAHIDLAVHEKVKDLIRFREDGVTIEESKLLDPAAQEIVSNLARDAFPEAVEAQESFGLKPLFDQAMAEKAAQAPAKAEGKAPTQTGPEGSPRAMFERAPPGMTAAEFDRYNRRIAETQAAVLDSATKIAERAKDAKLTKEWKAQEAVVRDEQAALLAERPDIAAERFIKKGNVKLDEESVALILGKDDALPQVMKAKGGAHPDDVAEFTGHGSGVEMVRELNALALERKASGESPTKQFSRMVDEATAREMEARHGTLGREIAEEARALALADKHFNILTDEMRALARAQGGEPPLSKDAIKAWAAEQFSALPTKQAGNYKGFQTAAERAGRAAEQALLKGDVVEAFLAKQMQVKAWLLAKESSAFLKEMAKAAKLFERFEPKTVTGVDQGFTDQIHDILSRIDYPTRRNKTELTQALEGKTLETFAEGKAGEGWELAIPEFLLTPWSKTIEQMTSSEFGQVYEAVQSLSHVGRESKFIEVEGKKIEFSLLRDEIISNLQTLSARELSDPVKASKLRFKIDAEITRMEAMTDDFDLRDPLGPFNTSVFRPITNAKHAENKKIEAVAKQVAKLGGDKAWRQGLEAKVNQDFFIDPLSGAPFDLTRGDLINIALNLGNRSNAAKLIKGYNVDEMKLRQLIDKELTKTDWDFVNGVWQIFKDLRPEIDAMYRELAGVPPSVVEAVPITTRHGEYPGGYFPIIYDKLRSSIDVIREKKGAVLENNYTRATTPNGYTKTRQEGFAEPLQIQTTIEAVTGKIQQIIHDLSFRRAVIGARQVIYDPEIRAAIRQNYGPEYEAQLSPWLENVANSLNTNDPAVSFTNSVLRKARMNLVVQALGLNLKVILSPDAGPIFAAANMKTATNMFRSFEQAQKDFSFAHAKSDELKFTMRNMDRDFNEKFSGLVKRHGWDAAQQEIARLAMVPAGSLSHIFRTVTWLTEYRQAIKDGVAEGDAIYRADKLVRRHHGASSEVDLPGLMRSTEGMKVLTIFQGFFNTMYNWQRQIPGEIRRGEYDKAAHTLIGATLIPAAFGIFLFNERRKEEKWGETLAKGMMTQLMATVPLLNIASNLFFQGYDSRLPMSSILRGGYDVYRDVVKKVGGKPADKAVQHMINLPGYLFGLPTGQFARSAQFMYDVKRRKQNPQNFGQYLKGLIYGKIEDKKR